MSEGILPDDFIKCLAKGRAWLVAHPDNRFCKNYGIRSHHLVPSKVQNIVPIMRSNSDGGSTHIGYYFSVMRHPTICTIEQRWKIFFDGKLKLDHERPIPHSGVGRYSTNHIKYQGRLVPRKELWRESH